MKVVSEVALVDLTIEWKSEKRKFDKIKKEISDCFNDNQCSECAKKLNKITNINYEKN